MTKTLTNDHRLADLMRDVAAYGGKQGEGRRGKELLAMRVIRAAADCVITLEVTKGPDGKNLPDDAHKVYAAYLAADSKKNAMDHTKDGIKKNASELRQIIGMGLMTTLGDGGPVDVFNRMVSIHQGLAVEERISAFPAFVAVARQQLASPDSPLTDNELAACCRKGETDAKTQAAYIKAAAKALEKALSAPDADPALAERIGLLADGAAAIMGMIDRAAARRELMAQLAVLDRAA